MLTFANDTDVQHIYVWAVDEDGTTEIDPRSEGERVVVVLVHPAERAAAAHDRIAGSLAQRE